MSRQHSDIDGTGRRWLRLSLRLAIFAAAAGVAWLLSSGTASAEGRPGSLPAPVSAAAHAAPLGLRSHAPLKALPYRVDRRSSAPVAHSGRLVSTTTTLVTRTASRTVSFAGDVVTDVPAVAGDSSRVLTLLPVTAPVNLGLPASAVLDAALRCAASSVAVYRASASTHEPLLGPIGAALGSTSQVSSFGAVVHRGALTQVLRTGVPTPAGVPPMPVPGGTPVSEVSGSVHVPTSGSAFLVPSVGRAYALRAQSGLAPDTVAMQLRSLRPSVSPD